MILGVDLGTSSVKVALVEPDGTPLATASRAYPLDTPRPGWAEQDPERWWDATCDAVHEATRSAGRTDVAAIGLSGQMHTLVLLDANDRAVRPALSWADGRSAAVLEDLSRRVPHERQVAVLGNRFVAGFTGPSLAWIRTYEPGSYAATRRVCLAKDALRLRMTGEWATDASDASATCLFHVAERRWSHEVIEALDLDPSLLPPVRDSAEVAGRLRLAAARELGLPADVPVATGAGDQAAAATGCGLVDPGATLATLGSGGQVFAPLDRPVPDPELRVHLFCHARPDRWHLQGAVQNVGLALDWARRALRCSWSEFVALAGAAPAGADGVTFVPYLTGERTPRMDPSARGAWTELSLAHGPEALARAALEGTTFAVADAVHAVGAVGAEVRTLAVTGGGAELDLTRRILADATGARIERAEVRDASVRGATVLAGATAPRFASEPEATDPSDADEHRAAYARYRRTAGTDAAITS